MPPDNLRPQDTRNKCWLTTLIICSAARTRLLISSVWARFIPAWFLDNPPSTISVWYRGNKCFLGYRGLCRPLKEELGSNPFVPLEVQQLGNERSLYPRFYSMNTSACITQSTNLLDLKLNKRIFYYYLHKSGGHLGLDETLEHVQETRSFHFCHSTEIGILFLDGNSVSKPFLHTHNLTLSTVFCQGITKAMSAEWLFLWRFMKRGQHCSRPTPPFVFLLYICPEQVPNEVVVISPINLVTTTKKWSKWTP
jgi:hypothetical protein